jgi:hypothetical protein
MWIAPICITRVVVGHVLQIPSYRIKTQPALWGGISQSHTAASGELSARTWAVDHLKGHRLIAKGHLGTLSVKAKPLWVLDFIKSVDERP